MTNRQEIELTMLDEARKLSNLRDAEYLNKKYSILMQNEQRKHRTSTSNHESRSAQATKDWIVEQQSIRSVKEVRTNAKNEVNPWQEYAIYERLDKLQLDVSSELLKNYPTPTKNPNPHTIPGFDDLVQCYVCEMAGECCNFEACLLCFRQCHYACMDVIMIDQDTRYICPSCKDVDRQSSRRQPDKPIISEDKVKTENPAYRVPANRELRIDQPEHLKICDVCGGTQHYSHMSIKTRGNEYRWICSKCNPERAVFLFKSVY